MLQFFCPKSTELTGIDQSGMQQTQVKMFRIFENLYGNGDTEEKIFICDFYVLVAGDIRVVTLLVNCS